MARYDDLDTRTIALSTIMSSIFLVIILLAARAMAYAWEYSYEEERAATAKYTVSDKEIEAQKDRLKSYTTDTVEGEEGQPPSTRNVIPIQRAQEFVRQELTAKPKT
jgi:hypothetical protein